MSVQELGASRIGVRNSPAREQHASLTGPPPPFHPSPLFHRMSRRPPKQACLQGSLRRPPRTPAQIRTPAKKQPPGMQQPIAQRNAKLSIRGNCSFACSGFMWLVRILNPQSTLPTLRSQLGFAQIGTCPTCAQLVGDCRGAHAADSTNVHSRTINALQAGTITNFRNCFSHRCSAKPNNHGASSHSENLKSSLED